MATHVYYNLEENYSLLNVMQLSWFRLPVIQKKLVSVAGHSKKGRKIYLCSVHKSYNEIWMEFLFIRGVIK